MVRKQVYPEVVVGAFIFNRKGEMLLVKSYKWPGIYAVAGGHVELGESVKQTAVREAFEETGLQIKFKHIISIQEAIYPKSFIRKVHFIFVEAYCTTASAKVKLDGDELQDYIWIKPRAALKLKLNTYTRKAINDIIKGRKYNL